MGINVVKVKQYNSTYKNILMIDGNPVCIVAGDRKASECIQYFSGYNVDVNDGKIKKILDKYRDNSINEIKKINGCCCCVSGASIYYEDEDNFAVITRDGKMCVGAYGESIEFKVKYCPNCGRKFN